MSPIPYTIESIDKEIKDLVARKKALEIEIESSSCFDENKYRQISILNLKIETLNNRKSSFKNLGEKLTRGSKAFDLPLSKSSL